MASAFNAQSDPGVVFKFFSASQQSMLLQCHKELDGSKAVEELDYTLLYKAYSSKGSNREQSNHPDEAGRKT